MLLSLTAVVLLATASCGDTAASAPTSDPATESASPSPSETGPQPSDQQVYDETLELLEDQGIEVGELVQHVNGAYPGIELTQDHELASDPWITDAELPEGWTEDDRTAAAVFGLNTVLALSVNNVTNDIEDTPEAIRKSINDLLIATHTDDVKEQARERIADHGWAIRSQGTPARLSEGIGKSGYDGVYDGLTPRIRTIDTEVCNTGPWRGGMYYEMSVDVDLNTVSGDSMPMVEPTRLITYFTAVKDESAGYRLKGARFNWALEGGEKTAVEMAHQVGVEAGDASDLNFSEAPDDFSCEWGENWAD